MIDLRNSYFSISDKVREALGQDFTDHRSETFLKYIADLENLFKSKFNTEYCTFVQGSGSLANELMLEEIEKQHPMELGIVMKHGEFGERLTHSCKLRKLYFVGLSEPYDTLYRVLQSLIERSREDINWILFPLCESSTGVVYELEKIVELCSSKGVKIYIDGMSYIGNAPVDLSGVTLMTGSSGKGLGSIPGIGVLLYNEFSDKVSKSKYLDLSFYRQKSNVPFTISTVQIKALGVSARERLTETNYQRVQRLREYIQSRVQNARFISLEIPDQRFVAFFSLKVADSISSKKLGEFLESHQIFLSFRTLYLIEKNCIEISLLDTHTTEEKLDTFFKLIDSYGENFSNRL